MSSKQARAAKGPIDALVITEEGARLIVGALFSTFSSRQRAVAELLLQGFGASEAAKSLGITRGRANQIQKRLVEWIGQSRFGMRLHRSTSPLLFTRDTSRERSSRSFRGTNFNGDTTRLVADLRPAGISTTQDGFAVRWEQDSGADVGITKGDTLIIERRIPTSGEIVLIASHSIPEVIPFSEAEKRVRATAFGPHKDRIRVGGVVVGIVRPVRANRARHPSGKTRTKATANAVGR